MAIKDYQPPRSARFRNRRRSPRKKVRGGGFFLRSLVLALLATGAAAFTGCGSSNSNFGTDISFDPSGNIATTPGSGATTGTL